MIAKWSVAVVVLIAASVSGCAVSENLGEQGPRAKAAPAVDPAQIQKAIDRGVDFLVLTQKKDGAWGGDRPKGRGDIFMPAPGGFSAMTGAVTSLAVMALIETNSNRPGAAEALRRGEDWLIENLPKVRISSTEAMYNNWTHAYGIQAMVRMLGREKDEARREAIRAIIRDQISRLERNQQLDGGWGYYSFTAKAEGFIRSADSSPFVTGTILIALYEAKEAGFQVSPRVTRAAVESIRMQRRPDFAYMYSFSHRQAPNYDVNQPPGSLARSQVCNAATRLWGDAAVTDGVLDAWVNRFVVQNGWLESARKRPVPHEGFYHIAAYFYYFGQYYAARSVELLPREKRPALWNHLATILLPQQEKDGSWWDFPMYDYHQQYGTAFALMVLEQCLPPQGRAGQQ